METFLLKDQFLKQIGLKSQMWSMSSSRYLLRRSLKEDPYDHIVGMGTFFTNFHMLCRFLRDDDRFPIEYNSLLRQIGHEAV